MSTPAPTIAVPTVALAEMMALLAVLEQQGGMSGHQRAMYLVIRQRMNGGKS